jgi:hypothetical protein
LAHKTRLTPPLFIKYLYPARKMSGHIFVLGVSILPLFTILIYSLFWQYDIFYFSFYINIIPVSFLTQFISWGEIPVTSSKHFRTVARLSNSVDNWMLCNVFCRNVIKLSLNLLSVNWSSDIHICFSISK